MYTVLILNLLIGPLLLLLAVLYRVWPPKRINMWYGHRTKRAMSSQEAWDTANRYSANALIMTSLGICVLQYVLYLKVERGYAILYSAIALSILVLVTFAITERKLGAEFTKKGKRKPL